ncbi:unnamed protein product [Phytophthora fragariaefolia]|uniref:Unnamed protein product n=1 Tax=Phytophthora fragariaefolia TaxID=1490495 RepID=A0A9W6TMH9_9STRA|nr:unnamed protein product [Phytophthora fragariaefolia]
MDKKYDSCSYMGRRTFLGGEFEVRLFEVDDAGIAAVVFQISTEHGSPLKFSRVFSRAELGKAGITKTLEGHVALVDSLELVEDAYFTGNDAVGAGQNVLAAYQLSSTLPGISFPPPIVSQQAALVYFARAPVGLSTWNNSRVPEEENFLIDLVVKGLTELCREKPPGLEAVKWLGKWFLDHNPAQPKVEFVVCSYCCGSIGTKVTMADELQSSEELAFVAEEVDRIILTSIEICLKDEVYDEQKVSQWVDYICESIMKGLSELRKPLKFIGKQRL